jgi:4-alpha-glucanotransferase
MTRRPDPLARLARLHGIELAFEDAYGNRQEVTPDTLRALLGAMGCAVGSAGEVAECLAAGERASWERLLEPVTVLRAGQPLSVTLSVPAGRGAGRLRWRLVYDSAPERRGEAEPSELPEVERASLGGQAFSRRRLALRLRPPPGEHVLEVEFAGSRAAMAVIVGPERAFGVADLGREQLWGVSAQLYSLRSGRDWGMGDFGDLGDLAELAAAQRASAVGVNPLHALFPAEPRHVSPYSPSDRLFLNPLYIDVEAVPELAQAEDARALLDSPELRARIRSARDDTYVDHLAVAHAKLPVLERLHATFRKLHLGDREESGRGRAFRAFQAEMGESLARHATFDALHERFYREGIWSWRAWPQALRDPASAEVKAFAADHASRVEFFAWLQWVADEQLAAAQRRALDAGMPIGIYRDLAVAVPPDGASVWGNPNAVVVGAAVGAPPDPFNAKGQNWGLAPLSPSGLRAEAYGLLARDLRQNMRHAGALRIDHVMGLSRLFWIPEGASPAEGAYVRYPYDDLLRIVALQSRRQRCLVIGEDLGTVEPGFRERMQAAGILSYRVLYFERDEDGAFLPPEDYPEQALVTVSTHDLPTLAGFWRGRDLEWRHDLDLHPDADALAETGRRRVEERRALVAALEAAGLLAEGEVDPEDDGELPSALLQAAHRFLAATPAQIMMVQLEDALGEVEQANLPGTTDQHPNWRRKLGRTLEEIAGTRLLAGLATILNQAGRGR